ncbi:histidine phosphatase family protein [Paenalkalicoccus suaedae]|nr:histidine phosphatase family protein [Paenalkalicoccus suaedae]
MMIIYFVRHGESEGNKKAMIQGQSEYPLTQTGENQAKQVAQALHDVGASTIYTSDLARAKNTAKPIAALQGKKAVESTLLREVFLGPLENRTREDILTSYPHINQIVTSGVEGTETIEALTERCHTQLKKWKKYHASETIIAVSHGGFISIFLMYLFAKENWHTLHRPFRIGNTGITRVRIEGDNVYFDYVNNTSHLAN